MNIGIEDIRPFPEGIDPEIVGKAMACEVKYIQYIGKRYIPRPWEIVGQATAKLRMYVENPEHHDPDGSNRKRCEAIIMAFDLEQGIFPPNFNFQTGLYTQEG